ncbi:hypothetical protein GY24_15075 [Microterricola pindariensis]|uniref:Uncharacterized protein n=2 Tax=Microterricola pindariensis TaxID=478010 RepID=A0ABX5ART9_9MICO|nr:hypothetical protein GY24_15075 [Microterricola pindariensis]
MDMRPFRGIKPIQACALSAGIVVALLSGCAAGPVAEPPRTDGPTAAPTAALPEETAAPRPTPTGPPTQPEQPPAPAIDLENPGTWLIGFEGIGPIDRGAQIIDVRPSMGAFSERTMPEWCPVAQFDRAGGPTVVATLDEDFATITGMFVGGGADPAATNESSPRTAEGIGIGSTLGEMLAAYPTITKSGEYGGGTPTLYYALQNPAGVWLVFAVYEEVVGAIFVRDTPRPPSEYCA